MKIFSGTSVGDILNEIKTLDFLYQKHSLNQSTLGTIGALKIDKFLDGEILPCFLESVRDEDVYFINTTHTSDSIMETLLVIDAAKRAGCKSFTLVAPYQGYSRQDKTDHLRSSIGSKMLADILTAAGMDQIITIDLHASSIQGFYDVPVIHLNGNKIFIEYLKNNPIEDLTIVAPDQGAVKRASDLYKAFPEATFAMVNKKRVKPNEIHSMELVGDVTGRNVIIVDDMVDTGNTLCKAAELIMHSGAKSVSCVITHGILSGMAIDVIERSVLTNLIVSNTIPSVVEKAKHCSKINVVSCAGLIFKSIRAISSHSSINAINSI